MEVEYSDLVLTVPLLRFSLFSWGKGRRVSLLTAELSVQGPGPAAHSDTTEAGRRPGGGGGGGQESAPPPPRASPHSPILGQLITFPPLSFLLSPAFRTLHSLILTFPAVPMSALSLFGSKKSTPRGGTLSGVISGVGKTQESGWVAPGLASTQTVSFFHCMVIFHIKCFSFLFFLGPHLQHVLVPRLGVKSEL